MSYQLVFRFSLFAIRPNLFQKYFFEQFFVTLRLFTTLTKNLEQLSCKKLLKFTFSNFSLKSNFGIERQCSRVTQLVEIASDFYFFLFCFFVTFFFGYFLKYYWLHSVIWLYFQKFIKLLERTFYLIILYFRKKNY